MRISQLAFTAACLALLACADDNTPGDFEDAAVVPGAEGAAADASSAGGAAADSAIANMRNAAGRELGTLTLTDTGRGVRVSGMLHYLPPGTHAIHIHTTGRCEPPFESAGTHWNPTSRQHGLENPQGAHLGDMPNFIVGPDSMATINVMTPADATLRGASGMLDQDGAAVMVHASPDDNRTDPAGNAGARIACGVVSGS